MLVFALAPAGAGHRGPRGDGPAGTLVFSDLPAGGLSGRDLFEVEVPGGDRRRLTDTRDRGEDDPAYSPSGDRVAFVSRGRGPGGDLESAIFVMPAEGGEAVQITGGPQDLDPAWRPDGGGLTFTSRFASVSAIVLALDDGFTQQPLAQLERAGHRLGEAAWSPDGARLALVVMSEAQGGELWSIAADGTGPRRLFRHPGWDDRAPAWSPDGRLIAFASGQYRPGATRHDLWLLDLNTGAAGTVVTDQDRDLGHPAWSPDGAHLAYDAYRPGAQSGALFTVAGPGASPVPVTSGNAADWRPAAVPSATVSATVTPAWSPTPAASPTAQAGTGTPAATSAPPGPSLPPPPPTAQPFPTPGPPEATSTGPAPAFPSPTASAHATATASLVAPGPLAATLFLPSLPGGNWPPAH